MEKERQDSAELQLARPWVNLEYLSENTNFYGNCLPLLCQKLIKIYVIFRYNYSRDECPRAGGRSRKCSSGGLCCFDGCRNACFNPEGQSLSSEIGSGSRKKFRRRHRRKRKNGKDSQVEEVDVYGAPGVINIANSFQTRSGIWSSWSKNKENSIFYYWGLCMHFFSYWKSHNLHI